jgi:hypothetical protein
MGLYAHARVHIAECLLNADDRPLPGRAGLAAPSEVDDLIAEALALGEKSKPIPFAKLILAMRAWYHGDSITAIELFDESLHYLQGEVHVMGWWGVWALLRVVADTDPEEAFGPVELTGHHVNWAARGFAAAVSDVRGGRSPAESIAKAEYYVRHTPVIRHLLHTIIAPVLYAAGVEAAMGWLREADAFCSAAGSAPCNVGYASHWRRSAPKSPKVQQQLSHHTWPDWASPRVKQKSCDSSTLDSAMPTSPIGYLSPPEPWNPTSGSMLQKTGRATREQLPSVTSAED